MLYWQLFVTAVFSVYVQGLSKLAENMSRKHTAGQLFCNAHIAVALQL